MNSYNGFLEFRCLNNAQKRSFSTNKYRYISYDIY